MKHRVQFSNAPLFAVLACLCIGGCGSGDSGPSTEQAASLPDKARIQEVRDYIKKAWTTLRRSHKDLLAAAPDPKVDHKEGAPWVIYIAADEDLDAIEAQLRSELGTQDAEKIKIERLPRSGPVDPQGLLYLPHPYVVPGGRFNEMYGWDSFFIQVGLLKDDELQLAKDMADNFIYEIEKYGTILNANRTYFLSRSQPPFLTEMILGVYSKTQDKDWLRSTWPAVEKYYSFWMKPPHLIEETGLSRYYDMGDGPAPEVLHGEMDDQGKTHYDRVRDFYRENPVSDYDVNEFYDKEGDRLTDLFYKGDRSMRESGFDPSNRFGQFNAAVVFYNPVCLNSLLYRMETEAAEIQKVLEDEAAAATWLGRAEERKKRVDQYLWDPEAGLYFDYNFKTKERRHYEYVTTFYPLWAGLASREQAAAVMKNLSKFEAPGGLLTSTVESGNQWDAPFGWAPLQMLAVEGMIRYGYGEDGRRIAANFLSMVTEDFQEHGAIVEKYDVVRRESKVSAGIRFGYSSNEIGFGWTNAAYLDFLEILGE